ALAFLGIGLLFANLNSLAMEPLETHAGLGASVIGSLSTLISVPLGTLIGQSYNGTVMPLVVGFMALGCLGLAIMEWTERHHKVALIRQN
ncbi:MAG TPA: Bcr/CflA family drug resistance efflux transporter, partial [Thiolinea sp.]|nr:Bcr/CflA family drug resistance efflux transporter [Thiolinea sp.]